MRARSADVTKALDLPVQRGEMLVGKYEVDRVVGSGGMGMVIRARHVQLDEMVAVKVLQPGFGGVEAVARFEREARAAAKLKGDHVARVIDLGRLAGGTPYMVMEYLDGEDLDQRLKRKGPLPIDEVVDFVTQACEAISEAHALGIIHRDLKSSNLFVIRCPDGSERVKVLDFGIAKIVGRDAAGPNMSMTSTFAVMGSPTYMSPEQLNSTRSVDSRTDVWALGVILYELLTARVPFDGDVLPELYLKIASGAPSPIERRDVPPGLEAVILRCLEKSREKRYRDVGELALALARFGPRRARDAAERASRIAQAARVSSKPRSSPAPRGRKVMAAALAGAVFLEAFSIARSCGDSSHAGTLAPASPSRLDAAEAR